MLVLPVARAVKIDMRVGCLLDGSVVYFDDNESVPCGPREDCDGEPHSFGMSCRRSFVIITRATNRPLMFIIMVRSGGHASEAIRLPEHVDICKVEISKSDDTLYGMRIHLTDGTNAGYLNEDTAEVETLSECPFALHERHISLNPAVAN